MNKYFFEVIEEDDTLSIAKHFFNSVTFSSFLNVLAYLVEGKGYGDEYFACEFPCKLDPESQFEGVRFRRFDDELVLSEEDFLSLLQMVCHIYIDYFPNDRLVVENTLMVKEI